MCYVITASKHTDRRTMSASSALNALTMLSLLHEAGFQVEHVMNEHGQTVSVQDLQDAAEDDESTPLDS